MPSYRHSWSDSPPSVSASLKEHHRLHQQPASSLYHDPKDKPKKPRHRHSAFQLAALNELYEKDEHPPLEERTSLAERLGMEVKTVNAWFQNKRASTKKRSNKSTGSAASSSREPHNSQCELPPISTLLASVSGPSSHLDYDEMMSDEEPYSDRLPPIPHQRQQSAFYAGNPQHRHLFDSETSMPRKARNRPSAAQTEELRKLYDATPHPSKEEREQLGIRIGMRYQSVTNWFQNQRSIAKKRKEDEEVALVAANIKDPRAHAYSSFPPSSGVAHPSLSVPPAKGHPSLPSLSHPPRVGRSPSLMDSRASSPRPSPYSTAMSERASSVSSRSRRTRPEPYQLEALKRLFQRTPTPSIEERGALALEINMDVGKVTNWFRNLRQSSRKRSKRAFEGSDDEDDDMSTSYNSVSRNVSREGSPVSVDPAEDYMVTDRPLPHEVLRYKLESDDKRVRMYTHASNSRSSDMASEEDFQEAVTPSPVSSPYPAMPAPQNVKKLVEAYLPQPRRDLAVPVDALSAAETAGVKIDDAILLLNFSNSTVR